MSEFGFASTADDVLEGKDLRGPTALITGGYSGLGKETARAMAAKGAHIILAGRDQAKLDEAAQEIAAETGATVDTQVVDLASLDSVRKAGAEARGRFDKIDLLINNAGVMACPQGTTADGFEMQFGTNHLGHFLLTSELMPLVEKGKRPRIVNLSSRGHHIAPVDLDDPNFESREYDKWISYGQSKTANILFSVGLEDRYGAKGVHAIALHPGGIMTNLGRHMTQEDVAWMMKRIEDNAKESGTQAQGFKTIPQGAATTCWAATCDELEGKGGVYCEDCHVAEQDDSDPAGGVRSYALDKGNADRLWDLSERLVGQAFAA
ncbi:SDR family NAD(P)-dependent oxidoreductase [Parerythrobacter lacustris]|uniref:SDR family NAD(P)-dependent oxidoreductase n=1 Tax=Parerythrobacter lacustris TaxID=2969984 RepID=A0ABT1XP50_9SPHN|nr:SDR family NAD(P)-dependent oxidoreductase [Parerythrobacter lacustris]MCR2832711.1 SDR family NAD(P)-dependent oxidoreductase [Parerythrobacter lacustris]